MAQSVSNRHTDEDYKMDIKGLMATEEGQRVYEKYCRMMELHYGNMGPYTELWEIKILEGFFLCTFGE